MVGGGIVSAPKKEIRLDKMMMDHDWLDDGRIQLLIDKYGEAGPTRYQRLACRIGREKGRIHHSVVASLSRLINCDPKVFLEFTEYAISIGLFYRDGDFIRAKTVDEDIQGVIEKRDSWNERQSRHRDKRVSHATPACDSEEEQEQEQEEETEKEQETELESGALEPPCPVLTATLEPEPDTPPPDTDPEIWKLTTGQFFDATHKKVQGDSRFVSAGRRPLKKYPEIWLTRFELYNWLKTYLESGIPPGNLQMGFLIVQSKLLTIEADKRRTQSVSAFVWGIGWVLQEVLEKCTKATNLERSKKYLEGARQ